MIMARREDERGATIILVAVLMVVFLGITALTIDGSHLYVVRNELQNAADAGALAGARFLYNDNGTEVNVGANQIAYDAARENKALAKTGGAIAVDVNFGGGQDLDVQRGHWSFATHTFTPNDTLVAVDLWGVSTEDLDANTDFINAIRVITRRQGTPAASFFARIFGYEGFEMSAEAIGYIGFAGTLAPGEVDAPIAICRQSITDDPNDGCKTDADYDCNMGYMLSDGQDKNTAAWTNFSQPCDTADTTDLRNLLTCADSNPVEINLGGAIGATNGVVDAVINHPVDSSLVNCWKNAQYDSNGDGEKDTPIPLDDRNGLPTRPWNLILPVVNCPSLQVSNCMETCGAVSVNLVWILEKENDIDADAPYKMFNPETNTFWENDSSDGAARWNDFVDTFNLMTPNGQLATVENDGFKKKSIYFLPDCNPHELTGNTGGENFGVLARIPVLVR